MKRLHVKVDPYKHSVTIWEGIRRKSNTVVRTDINSYFLGNMMLDYYIKMEERAREALKDNYMEKTARIRVRKERE